MRLEASVPSDDLSQPARRRHGRLHRPRLRPERSRAASSAIAPQADPATRQVPIYVTIPNVGGRLVAGLFAEGRVVSQSAERARRADRTPSTRPAQMPWVLRVTDGKDRARRRDAGSARSAHRAGAGRVGPERRRHAAARRGAGHHSGHASACDRAAIDGFADMFISDTAIKRPVLTVVAMLIARRLRHRRADPARHRRVPGDRRAGRRHRDSVSGRVARHRRARGRRADRRGDLRHQRRGSDALELARQLRQHHRGVRLREGPAGRDAGDPRRDLRHPQRSAAGDGGADPDAVRPGRSSRSCR